MKKIIMILVLALSLMLVACSVDEQPSLEENLTGIAATINGDEVLTEDVLAVQAQLQQQGLDADFNTSLNQLFVRLVLIQEAENRGYLVTNEEIEANFESQGISIEEIRNSVEMQGMTYDEFLEQQKSFLKLQYLIDDVSQDIVVSDEEAREFFDSQPELFEENVSFEDSKENIKGFISEQQASELLINLSQDLISQAEIEVYN